MQRTPLFDATGSNAVPLRPTVLEAFMRFLRPVVTLLAVSAVLLSPAVSAQRPSATMVRHQPTIASFLKPGLPIELVSARKVDRIAWIAYEEGTVSYTHLRAHETPEHLVCR